MRREKNIPPQDLHFVDLEAETQLIFTDALAPPEADLSEIELQTILTISSID